MKNTNTPQNDNQFILGKDSKERFISTDLMPMLKQLGISMMGTTEVFDEYLCSRIAPSRHRLLISVDGFAQVESAIGQFDILPMQSVLLPAGQDFTYQTKQYWQFVWFMFDEHTLIDLNSNSLSINRFEFAQEALHICVLLLVSNDLSFKKTLTDRLNHLLSQALKETTSTQKVIHKLEQVFNKIEQQLHLSWSVDQVASQMHCSKASLHRHCLEQYQCAPMHQITKLRMKRACDLLTQTDWSIKQISRQVGFKDPLNFSHRFKQWYQLSPKNYREQK